ncbi:unnamed protein product [Blepharisma stoltei]|uniref:Uncharacterized protein n=1 Tax=Blepharisma stoltei TaxID=1481888 RepID=A0AAU9K7Z4_9CILI|nr:unnamed protein product [Blepharisma stoltei]
MYYKPYGKPSSLNQSTVSLHKKSNSSLPSLLQITNPKPKAKEKTKFIRKKLGRTNSVINFWNPSPSHKISSHNEKIFTPIISNFQSRGNSPKNYSKGFELCYKLYPRPSFISGTEIKTSKCKKSLRIDYDFSNFDTERSIQAGNYGRPTSISRRALGNLISDQEIVPLTPNMIGKLNAPTSFSRMAEDSDKDMKSDIEKILENLQSSRARKRKFIMRNSRKSL